MAKITKCEFRECKHNNSCCSTGLYSETSVCTKEEVEIIRDYEEKTITCSSYEPSYNKPAMCQVCKVIGNGTIDIDIKSRHVMNELRGIFDTKI